MKLWWWGVGAVKAYRIARGLNKIVCFKRRRGFAPARRGPFVSVKVTKAIAVPSGIIGGGGTLTLKRTDQLAPLKQSPQADKSVPP
ncbi:MAG: hypothetical protein WD425_11440 [Nitrospirales bacterium]